MRIEIEAEVVDRSGRKLAVGQSPVHLSVGQKMTDKTSRDLVFDKQKPSLWKWAQHSIFLLGSIAVIFAAFSNTLNWYLISYNYHMIT